MRKLANLPQVIRAVIFDLDGTLIDTVGDIETALNMTLSALGRAHVPRHEVARIIGKGLDWTMAEALAATGGDLDGAHARAMVLFHEAYDQINGDHSSVFAGVLEGLRVLRQKDVAMACVTNKPLGHARDLLEKKRLKGFFAPIYGGDSFERKKPDPWPLLQVCEALDVAPAHTLMVGDSVNDAAAARAAGCPVVLMRYGYNHGRPVDEIDADGYFDSLLDVANAIA